MVDFAAEETVERAGFLAYRLVDFDGTGLVPPPGIEPGPQPSEGCMISVSPRGHRESLANLLPLGTFCLWSLGIRRRR